MNTRIQLRKKITPVAVTLIALGVIQTAVVAQPQFTLLHSFNGTDGFGPMAGVVQDADGTLYGTTSQGGGAGFGTVFRLDPMTLGLTTLHHFSGTDGSALYSGLVVGSDGWLYGSTNSGGLADLGTLFRVDTDGQGFASLHNFGGVDGARPGDMRLTQGGDGAFYGTTSEGGAGGGGTLFRLELATRALTTLYSFVAAAGVDAGLVAGRDGHWYGTTYSGGANGVGRVFRLDPITSEPVTLHDFAPGGGANPVPGALMQASDGNLYGTTQLGIGYGTVYKLNPTTLTFATLHAFSGTNDGRMPIGGVTEGGDGYLYGTTVLGGAGYGTVYRVHPTSLAYNIVVWFGGSNGRSPSGNLLRGSDGALYGITRLGGGFNSGTVFCVSFAAPAATLMSAMSRKDNISGPGGVCDVALLPARKSESRQGGVTQVRISFDVAPGGSTGFSIDQAICAAPAFLPYAGASVFAGSVSGNTLIIAATPGLENARTYRIKLGPPITSIPGQSVEIRGLIGDVDGDGLVSALDRSVAVGAWTGPGGLNCQTDVNSDGLTNALDRSVIVGAWTGPEDCAP